MQKIVLAPLVLLLALSACGKPETITAGNLMDPDAEKIKAAPPVKLPPAMLASTTYRCKDNSVVSVDWFNDGTTASIKPKKDATAISLTAPAPGQPYVGSDYEVTGTADAKSITVKKPGGSAQACDA
ncbi:hypothetical protein Q4F19_03810 [Sphingomonas sp. BIUV-7]|uniref:C-type lysozyme inhibitor domain-containing protein n=1 Tax=Sphingomonas natans TaxID=3063330 RepID=A0ABT8Y5A5_9SPHN|nr:hypothetical protein [Sphingomonas sp. BIUV-7]MDO6413501.1 hypothetical protein [Sphingomonas sp. BIUV-7]